MSYFAPGGTASAGSDYSGLAVGGGSVTFPDGVTYLDVQLPVVDDTVANEGLETVELTLAAGSGYTVVAPASATAGILDNDTPANPAKVWLDPGAVTLAEGDGGDIVVSRSGGDLSQPLTAGIAIGVDGDEHTLAGLNVDYALSGPSLSGSSAVFIDGLAMVTFGPGETSVVISVEAFADANQEGDEGVRFTVFGGGAMYTAGNTTGGGGTSDVLITDGANNPPQALDDSAVYLNGAMVLDVLANDRDPDEDPISVLAFSQPSAGQGTLALNPNGTFTYTPLSPNPAGLDTFTYTIQDSVGSQSTATVTVYLSPLFQYNNLLYSAGDGTTALQATVVRVGRQDVSSSVSFFADRMTAFAGLDFAATNGQLQFAPGVTSQTFTVPILDHAFFGYRGFHLALASPVNAVLSTSINGAIGEIVGNAPSPNFHPTTDFMPSVFRSGEPLEREKLESRNRMVFDPGMNALGATNPLTRTSRYEPPANSAKPGLTINGSVVTLVKQADKDMIDWILGNGRVTEKHPSFAYKKALLMRMIQSEQAAYSFPTKQAALTNIEFRLEAASAMMRMDGIVKPRINYSYAPTAADRKGDPTYWEKSKGYYTQKGIDDVITLVTKNNVDRYDAVKIGIEGGETLMECYTGLSVAYYVAATRMLTRQQFNDRFPSIELTTSPLLTSGDKNGNPFIASYADPASMKLALLREKFMKNRNDYIDAVQSGKAGGDGALVKAMNETRGEIRDYFAKKKLEPTTGDSVYFVNSRFYPLVYPQGFWQGENTIAFVNDKGKLLYTGLGLAASIDKNTLQPSTEEQIVTELKKNINGSAVAITTFIDTLKGRQAVIDAAAEMAARQPNGGWTAEKYARSLFSEATELDVGMFSIYQAVL